VLLHVDPAERERRFCWIMVRFATPHGQPRRPSSAPRVALRRVAPTVVEGADAAPPEMRSAASQARLEVYHDQCPVASLAPPPETERPRLGLAASRECAMCLHSFPPEALKVLITWKAILEQRARWGVAELTRRDIAPGTLYQERRVCVFCAQYFHEDVIALRTEDPTVVAFQQRRAAAAEASRATARGSAMRPMSPDSLNGSILSRSEHTTPAFGALPEKASPTCPSPKSDTTSFDGLDHPHRQTMTPSAMRKASAQRNVDDSEVGDAILPAAAARASRAVNGGIRPPRVGGVALAMGEHQRSRLENEFCARVLQETAARRRNHRGLRSSAGQEPKVVRGSSRGVSGSLEHALRLEFAVERTLHMQRLLEDRERRKAGAGAAIQLSALLRHHLPLPVGYLRGNSETPSHNSPSRVRSTALAVRELCNQHHVHFS
jgi:hypothetical protein